MNICPCCSDHLLRHVRHSDVYWFCRHCWQEMPDCSTQSSVSFKSFCALDYGFNRLSSAIVKVSNSGLTQRHQIWSVTQ